MDIKSQTSNCWDPNTNVVLSPVVACAANFRCQYTSTYAPGFLSFPTTTTNCAPAASSCPANPNNPNVVCSAAAAAGAITDLRTDLASCVTLASLPSTISVSTLSPTQTCTTGTWCKNVYTLNANGAVTGLTASCAAAAAGTAGCVTSTSLTISPVTLCTIVANANAIFACYVGTLYQITSTTNVNSFVATVCPPSTKSFCKNVITWASATGYQVVGTCESVCNAVTVSLTGTTSTTGTTCTSTVLGNSYSFSSSPITTSSFISIMISFCLLFLI